MNHYLKGATETLRDRKIAIEKALGPDFPAKVRFGAHRVEILTNVSSGKVGAVLLQEGWITDGYIVMR